MQKYRILTDTAMHLLMYHGRRNENTQTNLDAIVPQKKRSNKLGPVYSSLIFCFDGILKKISLQPFGLLEGKVTARYGYFFFDQNYICANSFDCHIWLFNKTHKL